MELKIENSNEILSVEGLKLELEKRDAVLKDISSKLAEVLDFYTEKYFSYDYINNEIVTKTADSRCVLFIFDISSRGKSLFSLQNAFGCRYMSFDTIINELCFKGLFRRKQIVLKHIDLSKLLEDLNVLNDTDKATVLIDTYKISKKFHSIMMELKSKGYGLLGYTKIKPMECYKEKDEEQPHDLIIKVYVKKEETDSNSNEQVKEEKVDTTIIND